MLDPSALVAYVAALAIAVAIPGPGIVALMGQALGNGLRASMVFLAGILLGDIVYLTIAVAGLAALAQLFAGAFLLVKIAGGLYLLYLSFRFWTSKAGLSRMEKAGKSSDMATFLSGFAVTLGNPKAIVFYLALLPNVIDLQSVAFRDWAVMVALTSMVLATVLTPYAILAAKAQKAMSRSGALVRMNRIAAGIIGAAGAMILAQAALSALRKT